MKPKCREVIQRIYFYLDAEVLTEVERNEIQVHLDDCEPCLERFHVEQGVTRLLRAHLEGHDPCPGRLKAKIENLLSSSE